MYWLTDEELWLLGDEEEAGDTQPESPLTCPNGCGRLREDGPGRTRCPVCDYWRVETRLDKDAVFG